MSTRRIFAALTILAAIMLYSAPRAHAWDVFGLFPNAVEGVCSAVSPTYVAVLDSHQKPHVFVIPEGMVPPPALSAGRKVRVEYKKRNDGAMVVKHIKVL